MMIIMLYQAEFVNPYNYKTIEFGYSSENNEYTLVDHDKVWTYHSINEMRDNIKDQQLLKAILNYVMKFIVFR